MNRRTFLAQSSALMATAFCASHPHRLSAAEKRPARHLPAHVVSAPELPLPTGKRASFGWKIAAITDTPLVLRWADDVAGEPPGELRITVGLDVRDEKRIEATLPGTRHVIGTFDVRFASLFQPYSIALSPADAAAVLRAGVALRVTRGTPLHVLVSGADLPAELQPHLLVPGTTTPREEFYSRLGSLASIQPWSWNEGCVLDGLMDLGALPGRAAFRATAERHLAQFVRDGALVYESPVSAVSDGKVYGIEGTLPFATLAQIDPRHPLLELAVQFWLAHHDGEGVILDGRQTTSEGAYTVGYPLALIGRARRDDTLQRLALTQLRLRRERLFDGQTFWRTRDAEGTKGNRNWARGIAWQLLGEARTLRVLRLHPAAPALFAGFRDLAVWIQRAQRPDGLWSVFVDEPQLPPDTAGSAGIAAALAIGVEQGRLPLSARTAAARCLAGLDAHLTRDGFLGGVSQSNKGGEELQRGGYRVIYQMAMGLMAQLIAALESSR